MEQKEDTKGKNTYVIARTLSNFIALRELLNARGETRVSFLALSCTVALYLGCVGNEGSRKLGQSTDEHVCRLKLPRSLQFCCCCFPSHVFALHSGWVPFDPQVHDYWNLKWKQSPFLDAEYQGQDLHADQFINHFQRSRKRERDRR